MFTICIAFLSSKSLVPLLMFILCSSCLAYLFTIAIYIHVHMFIFCSSYIVHTPSVSKQFLGSTIYYIYIPIRIIFFCSPCIPSLSEQSLGCTIYIYIPIPTYVYLKLILYTYAVLTLLRISCIYIQFNMNLHLRYLLSLSEQSLGSTICLFYAHLYTFSVSLSLLYLCIFI